MDSIEEMMMGMSYSQQAANLDGGEDVVQAKMVAQEQCRSSGRDDWPVRIASSCRRQPQKSIVLPTLASKITNKYSTMEEYGRASLPASFWYLYYLPHHFFATRKFTAIALVF